MLATIQPRTFGLLVFCLKKLTIRLYKTINFPVVLYGCDTRPLTLREEYILRVFKKRFLKRIFGPKRNEVTEDLEKTA
jgi:hypothetical protein